MKKVIVRAPVRADLAGGTLDLWPIYLFHPGSRTVNVAVSLYAESEISETGEGEIEIHLTDLQHGRRYDSIHDLAADPKAALIHRAVEHFHLTGIRIVTRTDAPRGSGLGGSSALAITLVRGLSEIAGRPFHGDDLICLVRDLETRLLGIPAGIQDYYAPVYGGLAAIHLDPGTPVRHAITIPIHDLAAHMLLHYTGVAHFSGTNNWEMYKRQIEGKKRVQRGLAKIAETAIEMERALESGNFEAAGKALQHEWENRKALVDGISTPEVEAAIDVAVGAGAWGGKVCGAGGGGCVVFLFPPEKRDAIVRALGTVPGRVLDAMPVAHGMTIVSEEGAQTAFSFARTRLGQAAPEGEPIEQLYVYGGTGDYHPYVLAEGVIIHREPRSGVHQTIVRSYVAPVETSDGTVRWGEATTIDPESLDIRAVPDPDRRIPVALSPETLVEGAARSEESFRQYLEEWQRLTVFHNAAFGLYSEPQESHVAFLDRCMDEAKRRIEEKAARLESTFRRRIDQVKERSEREQRELEAKEEVPSEEVVQDVNVAWGQALYNITSGRPAAVAEAQTVRDVDYLEKIAEIQRAWEKELEALREELTTRAREIEGVEIIPTAKDIEVTRYVILWAPKL